MKNLILSVLVMMNALISNAQITWVKNMSKSIGAYSDIYQLKKPQNRTKT